MVRVSKRVDSKNICCTVSILRKKKVFLAAKRSRKSDKILNVRKTKNTLLTVRVSER